MGKLFKIIVILIILNSALAKPISLEHSRTKHTTGPAHQQQQMHGNTQEQYKQNLQLRQSRQIVQPTWLTQQSAFGLPIDSTVRVNAQNLQEAAELRKEIQQAVLEGRYAVPAFDEAGNPISPMQMQYGFSQFQFPQWNFQYAGQLPQWNLQPTSFNWQQLQVQAQQYMAALQQRWLEMWSKSNAPAITT